MTTQVFEKDGVQIFIDDDAQNPRTEWDNLGTMVCFHKRYCLGDTGHGYRAEDFSGWDGLQRQIEEDHGPCTILPIYMYDHSGLTISTEPFSCPWDSGQIGFIYCSEARAQDQGVDAPIAALESEVETYDQYLCGECYGYEHGEDSCWGFYGYEPEELADAVLKGEV